jgi:protein-arginine kinase
MIKTLKLINEMVASATPDDYGSVSYNRYFRNLSEISTSIIDEKEEMDKILQRVKDSICKMDNGKEKSELVFLINGGVYA